MKSSRHLFVLAIWATISVSLFCAPANASASNSPKVPILKQWSGDYPVAELNRLPEAQRDSRTGYIADADTFAAVWQAFKPGETVPQANFAHNMIVYTRNVKFYNRTSIMAISLQEGVAEIIAMETMSALPIEDKVAMSLAVVPREGIKSIRTADGTLVISGTAPSPQTRAYECGGGYHFTARIGGEKAWLFLPHQTVRLPRVPSGSDAKYRDFGRQ